MLGWGIVEQHHLTVRDECDFLIEICNGGIDINCVVDTAFLIHLPVIQSQLFGEQDDVYIFTFLFDIGDGRDIFRLDTLFVEQDEMLVTNMRGTGRGSILIVGRKLNQPSGNVSQSFLGFWIVAKIYNAYHIYYIICIYL